MLRLDGGWRRWGLTAGALATLLWGFSSGFASAKPVAPAAWPVLLTPTPAPLPAPPARWSREAWLDQLHVAKWRQLPPPGAPAAVAQWRDSNPVQLWAPWAREPIAAFDRLDPPRAARALAYSSVATYEALRTVKSASQRYPRLGPAGTPSYPDALAAVCAAQSGILGACFPDWASGLNRRAEALAWLHVAAGRAYPSDVRAGWQAGQSAAHAALGRLERDRHAPPAPPAAWALSPEAGTWQTWRPHARLGQSPPEITPGSEARRRQDSWRTTQSLDIRRRNLVMKWLRTDPASLWHARVASLCAQAGHTPLKTAYILALTSMALQDAAVCAWREQAHFRRSRPRAEQLGLLLPLPDHPAYPSDAAAMAHAAAGVAVAFFPAERQALHNDAHEAAQAAVDAGWCDAWDRQGGEAVGRSVARAFLPPLEASQPE